MISRLGDCSPGPQWLIYVCTWNWLHEAKCIVGEVNEYGMRAVNAPSLPAQRCPLMLEMSRSENIPHCPCVVVHLIELSHDPLSSGYTYDSVPLGRAMMEHDRQIRLPSIDNYPSNTRVCNCFWRYFNESFTANTQTWLSTKGLYGIIPPQEGFLIKSRFLVWFWDSMR